MSNILNLSNHELSETERSLLNKGLNYSIKRKGNQIQQKIAMEKLFHNVSEKEAKNKVAVHEKEHLIYVFPFSI